MQKLNLALDIAKIVTEAGEKNDALDVSATAKQLSKAHPESNASREEISEVLNDESQAAGLDTA